MPKRPFLFSLILPLMFVLLSACKDEDGPVGPEPSVNGFGYAGVPWVGGIIRTDGTLSLKVKEFVDIATPESEQVVQSVALDLGDYYWLVVLLKNGSIWSTHFNPKSLAISQWSKIEVSVQSSVKVIKLARVKPDPVLAFYTTDGSMQLCSKAYMKPSTPRCFNLTTPPALSDFIVYASVDFTPEDDHYFTVFGMKTQGGVSTARFSYLDENQGNTTWIDHPKIPVYVKQLVAAKGRRGFLGLFGKVEDAFHSLFHDWDWMKEDSRFGKMYTRSLAASVIQGESLMQLSAVNERGEVLYTDPFEKSSPGPIKWHKDPKAPPAEKVFAIE